MSFYNYDGLSFLNEKILLNNSITSDTTTPGTVLDINDTILQVIATKIIVSNRTDGVYTPLLEWSDDNITFTAIPDQYISFKDANGLPLFSGQEALAALNVNGEVRIGFKADKRYFKISIVSTGVTTGAFVVALATLVKKVAN